MNVTMKRKKSYRFFSMAIALAIILAIFPAAVSANDGDPVISEATHPDGVMTISGLNITLTVPNSNNNSTFDIASKTTPTIAPGYSIVSVSFSNYSNGVAVPLDAPVSMEVQFQKIQGLNLMGPYTTNYTVRVVKAPPLPASFSGEISKGVTLPAQLISFTSAEFTSLYQRGDDGEITHVSITGPASGIGSLKTNGSEYYLGDPIAVANLSQLTFTASSAGEVNYNVYAHTSAGGARIGAVTLSITVTPPVVSGDPVISGNYNKSNVLVGATVTFNQSDFTNRVTSGALNWIRITNITSNGTLRLNNVAYTLNTPIQLSDVTYLSFLTSGTGVVTITWQGSSDNVTYPAATATVSFTVTSSSSQNNISEIRYDTYYDTTVTFVSADFSDALRSSTGRTLSYVIFSLPSTSEGRLYYNYRSSTNYGTLVSASTSYYRDTTPRISDITFVPSRSYYGTVRISYVAYDTVGTSHTGEVRIWVDDDYYNSSSNNPNYYYGDYSVRYSTEVNTPVNFNVNDFTSSFSSAIGLSLSHIRFTLPSTSAGTLYYNYNSSSSYTSTVSSTTSYYRNSSPYIGSITFVPATGYSGTVVIYYTGYSTGSSSGSSTYGGTLYIDVGAGSGAGNEVSYTTEKGVPVKLVGTDFRNAFARRTTYAFSGVVFTPPSASVGKLYYNYASENSFDYEVTGSRRFYQSSSPSISSITFVPAANYTGDATISYISYSTSGYSYPGVLNIKVGTTKTSTGWVAPISYTSEKGAPVFIESDDINKAIQTASGDDLDYITFTELPSASIGTLYYDYLAPDNFDSIVNRSDMYFHLASPYISDISFVPNASTITRVANIKYKAFTESGASLEGDILITVRGGEGGEGGWYGGSDATSSGNQPSYWAQDEVNSLLTRNIVPEELTSKYAERITRAEFTALLVNTYIYARGPRIMVRTPTFGDIDFSLYKSQIEMAYDLYIIEGYSATEFAPEDYLTREQAAKILCASVAALTDGKISSDYQLGYADLSSISDWALVYVACATEKGLMIGAEDNLFKPLDNLTREEAMLLVERLIVKYL